MLNFKEYFSPAGTDKWSLANAVLQEGTSECQANPWVSFFSPVSHLPLSLRLTLSTARTLLFFSLELAGTSYAIIMLLEKLSERCCDSSVFHLQFRATPKHKNFCLFNKYFKEWTLCLLHTKAEWRAHFLDTFRQIIEKFLAKHT